MHTLDQIRLWTSFESSPASVNGSKISVRTTVNKGCGKEISEDYATKIVQSEERRLFSDFKNLKFKPFYPQKKRL